MTTTYFASVGELFLISSLIYLIVMAKRYNEEKQQALVVSAIMVGALCVILASSIGIFRFAGFEQFNFAHDTTSYYAKHLGMVLYAAGFTWLLLADKYQSLIKLLAVAGFLSAGLLPEFVADVALFSLLALSAFKSEFTKPIAIALLFLLLVPLTELLPANLDVQMGVFHVLLAAHFTMIARVLRVKSQS